MKVGRSGGGGGTEVVLVVLRSCMLLVSCSDVCLSLSAIGSGRVQARRTLHSWLHKSTGHDIHSGSGRLWLDVLHMHAFQLRLLAPSMSFVRVSSRITLSMLALLMRSQISPRYTKGGFQSHQAVHQRGQLPQ